MEAKHYNSYPTHFEESTGPQLFAKLEGVAHKNVQNLLE